MKLHGEAVAYLLGSAGSTKRRLENFTGCVLEVRGGNVELEGTKEQRNLARLCIEITLQQRERTKRMDVDFESLEKRDDCTFLDVPLDAVGYVLGSRGATLRQFEESSKTYLFFDNDTVRDGKKRLYILGKSRARSRALFDVEDAVQFQLHKRRPGRHNRSRSRGRREHQDRRQADTREQRWRRPRSKERRKRSRSAGERRKRSRSRERRRRR